MKPRELCGMHTQQAKLRKAFCIKTRASPLKIGVVSGIVTLELYVSRVEPTGRP